MRDETLYREQRFQIANEVAERFRQLAAKEPDFNADAMGRTAILTEMLIEERERNAQLKVAMHTAWTNEQRTHSKLQLLRCDYNTLSIKTADADHQRERADLATKAKEQAERERDYVIAAERKRTDEAWKELLKRDKTIEYLRSWEVPNDIITMQARQLEEMSEKYSDPGALVPEQLTALIEDNLKNITQLQRQLAEATRFVSERDAPVYEERNRCVAAMTRMAQLLGWPTWLDEHMDVPGETWDPEWRNVVFIHLPTGQVSWHIHDRDKVMFRHVAPRVRAILTTSRLLEWDRHTTVQKYGRMTEFCEMTDADIAAYKNTK